jgi:glycosyltransferase involved in cell wall biosynthesis
MKASSLSITVKPTVCHVITGLHTGGCETMLFKLLSCAGWENYNHVVIEMVPGGQFKTRIEKLGIPVYSLHMRPGFPSLRNILRLRSLARKIRPSIWQGWMYHGNFAALSAKFLAGTRSPVIWNIRHSLHDLKNEKYLTRLLIIVGARLSSLVSIILYNSKASAAQHEHIGYPVRKTKVIPNGFDCATFIPDTAAYQSVRVEMGLSCDASLIGLIARYDPLKGHTYFLQAAAQLVQHLPAIRFLLAGRGVDANNAELTATIERLGLKSYVHLLGERDDIPRLTAALDIATSSSISEAFPNVLGEAMASGVPCVVTDVGDSAWIIGDNGRVVAPGNATELTTAWQALLSCDKKTLSEIGMRGRDRINDLFSLSAVCQQYVTLYGGLLNAGLDVL